MESIKSALLHFSSKYVIFLGRNTFFIVRNGKKKAKNITIEMNQLSNELHRSLFIEEFCTRFTPVGVLEAKNDAPAEREVSVENQKEY